MLSNYISNLPTILANTNLIALWIHIFLKLLLRFFKNDATQIFLKILNFLFAPSVISRGAKRPWPLGLHPLFA